MMYYIRKEKTILSEMAVCCCDSKGPSRGLPDEKSSIDFLDNRNGHLV